MARLEEADPRWIIDIRPDGTNVDNWHWTERNCISWAKEYFKNSLDGYKSRKDNYEFEIVSNSIEGVCSVGTRKNKVKCFFDLEISINWKGKLLDEKDVEGTYRIIDFTSDTFFSDLEKRITCNDENSETPNTKLIAQEFLAEKLKNIIDSFSDNLLSAHSDSVLLPTSTTKESSTSFTNPLSLDNSTKQASTEQNIKSQSNLSCTDIQVTFDFSASIDDLFECFVNQQRILAWTRQNAEITPEPSKSFSFFNGSITGKFIDIIHNKKIVQTWRAKEWAEGHYSTVTLEFVQEDDGTSLHLIQHNVPKKEYDKTRYTWEVQYFNAIKITFGFGGLY